MRNITKIKRSIRAISPVISVLLMIAIAVVAALVAYAWVMGYLGGQTSKAGNGIQLQSFTTQGNLVLYVQNTGQGTVHLKHDGAVYVNDVLQKILLVDDTPASNGELDPIPIAEGQTVTLVIDYIPVPNEELRIKIVTMEGTFIEGSGKAGQQSTVANINFLKNPTTAASSITSPATTYYVGSVISVKANVASGEEFLRWESSSPSIIKVYGERESSTLIKVGAATGSVTGYFRDLDSTTKYLRFTGGFDQKDINVNELSGAITVQRYQATGEITINLQTTSGTGVFCNSAGTSIGTSIATQGGSAKFYYKDTTAGSFTITAKADGYEQDSTTIGIINPEAPTPVNNPPTASFTYTANGLTAQFNDVCADSDGSIASRSWSFGDSTFGTTEDPSHTYNAAGTYTVSLTVTDNKGATFTYSNDAVIVTAPENPPPVNNPPTAMFSINGINGLKVQFTDSSSDSDGTIASRSWNFGDGNQSFITTATSFIHTYSSAGTYTVKLTVTDDDGASNTKTIDNIQVSTPVVVQYKVTFSGTGLSGDATGNLVTYSISNGTTGVITVTGVKDIFVQQGLTLTYTFVDPVTSSVSNKQYNLQGIATDQVVSIAADTPVTRNYIAQTGVFNSGFDGDPWNAGWNIGSSPPFYGAAGEGIDGSDAAKSDPWDGNTGAFSSGIKTSGDRGTEINTNLPGATIIEIRFMYKLQDLDSADDFRIAYSKVDDPLTKSNSFIYVADFGIPTTQPNADGWYEGIYIIAKNEAAAQTAGADIIDAGAFTQYFSFRFHTDLEGEREWNWSTWSYQIVREEIVWVDDVSIIVR